MNRVENEQKLRTKETSYEEWLNMTVTGTSNMVYLPYAEVLEREKLGEFGRWHVLNTGKKYDAYTEMELVFSPELSIRHYYFAGEADNGYYLEVREGKKTYQLRLTVEEIKQMAIERNGMY